MWLPRDRSVRRVRERRHVVVPAEDHRERRLDRARRVLRAVDRRTRPEHGAAREVLDLALAVDRRVGDDRDGLLEVVGQVLALLRERRQRPVVAERADRLGAVGRHLLHELGVLALPAHARQDPVVDLHRLGRAGGVVARDLRPLQRASRRDRLLEAGDGLRTRALEPALVHELLHLLVVEQPCALVALHAHQHLLAGRQRLRLADHLRERDDAGLGAEDIGILGRDLPQRAQPERVDREHVLVAVARDQRDRPLRERTHRLAQVHVEAAQLLRELADLVDDRRHGQLHRLGQRKAAPVNERLDQAVEVLRVRRVVADRRAQHERLRAQPRDRVDLAVVAQHREGLDPHERRPRVGRVAVVAEQRDRLAAGVEEVLEVVLEHERCAHHLVDAALRGQRRDVRVERALDLDRDVEQNPVAALGVGDEHPDLPEVRLLLARGRAERRARDPVLALGQHPQAVAVQDLAGALLDLPEVGRPRHEHVRDGEGRVEREARRVAAGADLLLPDQARDVDHRPAAVALAVDVPGAVEHLLKGDEALLDHVMRRAAVAADGGIERARVLVLDRLRRAAGPVGLG